MRTIEDVLDEMIGANYMITDSQIKEIREIHAAEPATDTNVGDNISRQAAISLLHKHFDNMLETDTICPQDLYGDFEALPPAPERTGWWIELGSTFGIPEHKCSGCGQTVYFFNEEKNNTGCYCGKCGRHMIEEVDNDTT